VIDYYSYMNRRGVTISKMFHYYPPEQGTRVTLTELEITGFTTEHTDVRVKLLSGRTEDFRSVM
jgi:hypothetical protein